MRHWFLLLTPAQTTSIMLDGDDVVGGPVVPVDAAADPAVFADADAARAAFGHPEPEPGRGRFVDFLVLPELTGVVVDTQGDEHTLRTTRAPSGAAFWRLEADGRRRVISYYDTPAYGWRNGRGAVSPAEHVGLRGHWTDDEGHQLDLVAAFEDGVDGVHLVALGDTPPPGFSWTKLGVSRRTVPLADVDLYDVASGTRPL